MVFSDCKQLYNEISSKANTCSKNTKRKSIFTSILLSIMAIIPYACIGYCFCIFFLFESIVMYLFIGVSAIFVMFIAFLANYFYYASVFDLEFDKKISFGSLLKGYVVSIDGIVTNVLVLIVAIIIAVFLAILFY